MSSQNINVFLRCRPLKPGEQQSALEFNLNQNEIIHKAQAKGFVFDKIFPEHSSQDLIYQTVAAPLIDDVISGLNCTVFAYGQTGTGKTYTMEGYDEAGEKCGIITRSVMQIFDALAQKDKKYVVKVSFLELYNEDAYDLLSDTTKLKIYEDLLRSVKVEGLTEIELQSSEDIHSILTRGASKRQTASTLYNLHSSRSHSIFTLCVFEQNKDLQLVGKLNLVDLAGSENIARSGAMHKNAREAGNINQSLLTLTRVISALLEKRPHIPYRESKLTRILQDSLGGSSKTSMIATISLADGDLANTLSTLDYAARARSIANKLEYNRYTLDPKRDFEKERLSLMEKHAAELSHQEFRIRDEVALDFRREVEKRERQHKEEMDALKVRFQQELDNQKKYYEGEVRLLGKMVENKAEEILRYEQRCNELEQQLLNNKQDSPCETRKPAKRIRKQAPNKVADYANMTFDGDDEIVQLSTKKTHRKLTTCQQLTLSGKKKRLTTAGVDIELSPMSPPKRVTRTRAAKRKLDL